MEDIIEGVKGTLECESHCHLVYHKSNELDKIHNKDYKTLYSKKQHKRAT